MAQKTAHMPEDFKAVQDLENQCNFIETHTPGGKLLSLEAVGKAADHITDGVFERTAGAPMGKGDVTVKLDNGGTNTAWINRVKVKVSFKHG